MTARTTSHWWFLLVTLYVLNEPLWEEHRPATVRAHDHTPGACGHPESAREATSPTPQLPNFYSHPKERRNADLFQVNGDCLGIKWGTRKRMQTRLLMFSRWSRIWPCTEILQSLRNYADDFFGRTKKSHDVYQTRGFFVESRLALKKVVHQPASFPWPEEPIHNSEPKPPEHPEILHHKNENHRNRGLVNVVNCLLHTWWKVT